MSDGIGWGGVWLAAGWTEEYGLKDPPAPFFRRVAATDHPPPEP